MKKLITILIAGILLCPFTAAGNGKVVHLVSDCWKPYICGEREGEEGIAVDIARQIFTKAGYQFKFSKLPWNRAVLETRKGLYNGIVCATKGDAPDFIYPEEHVTVQKTCFFVRKESEWQYSSLASLDQVVLGTIDGYHYSKELDSYIEEEKEGDKLQAVFGEQPLKQNVLKLKGKRISAFIEDPAVVQHYIAEKNEQELKSAGCVEDQVKLYIPFSPELPESHLYAELLSKGIREMHVSGEIAEIYEGYGVEYPGE